MCKETANPFVLIIGIGIACFAYNAVAAGN
jgi:hypothetical protein